MNTSGPPRAVQYIRMSTDSQDLSPEMQQGAIAAYAGQHGIAVVQTYLDAGKSGLTLEKRPAMRRLLLDVTKPDRTFSMVLVYDVSRWGRFQDTDASAYYEYHCRLHGCQVHYVQEPFGSPDSPLATLFKGMKRAMAAEFSRELAVKTTAGHAAAMQRGFQLGTMPCVGFARVAVSKMDGSQRRLRSDEHKSGPREHVKWVLGPQPERAAVRRIFQLYATTEPSVVALARRIEREGIRTADGRCITEWMLYSFLRSESVLGNFLWGRAKNKKRRAEGDPRFTRMPGIMEPLVPRELFDAVQAKLNRRRHVIFSREALVDRLRAALVEAPKLRALQLEVHGCPCRSTYLKNFGSIRAAWAAAGAVYPCGAEGIDQAAAQRSASVGARICNAAHAFLRQAGVDCQQHTRPDRRGQTLLINGDTVLRLQVIWQRSRDDLQQWEIRRVYKEHFDWILVVRIRPDDTPLDSILLSRAQYFSQTRWLHDALDDSWTVLRSSSEIVDAMRKLRPMSCNRPVGPEAQPAYGLATPPLSAAVNAAGAPAAER
ncbi:recombinase family protein [Ramlibacter ginsenosidimutans]|uniref:Recombinase family protein n=1 Tax=Ramlibacter ginsenosidimutans TaxID=502333 RepID=A0A934TWV1_9BURK|nr:recombinase family protein [Ramlibacter ginsenosidimutans]MBK6008726.1 recombinase family protein [Ramlibacter ginsenosidimutans]